MRVCYVTLVAAPWLAIAGALAALYGLLVGGEAGQALGGATAAAAAVGAGGLAYGLLRAQVANEERRQPRSVVRPGRPR